MTNEEILESFKYYGDVFPHEALAAALEKPEGIIPGLIGFIRYAREHAETLGKPEGPRYMGHVYAMFLLAQFREQSAGSPVVDFFGSLPEQTLDDLTGDIITEDLHRILASVACTDDAPIRALVENESASPWVRAAAVQAFVTLVANGFKSRNEVIAYFTHLFRGGIRREPSALWDTLVCCTTDLNPADLYTEIVKADEEGLFEIWFISAKEINKQKNWPIEKSLARLHLHDNYSLVTDAATDLYKWAMFMADQDEPIGLEEADFEEFDEDPPYFDLSPVCGEPKIGRNEPCPCGSGKKYKKCCLEKYLNRDLQDESDGPE